MGSFWFGEPHVLVNSFLLDGLLIDSGHPRMGNFFIDKLRLHAISKCIITHHHEDHSGNARLVSKKLNIPTYASPRCVEILKKPPRVSPIQYVTWGQNKSADLIPLVLSERIETNNYSFEIIETPGHAEDMIALYEPQKGWLFSSDNYLNSYINLFMDNEDMSDHIRSLKKLIELDFDVLLCNHNPQFRNGKAYLRSKLQFLVEFTRKVNERASNGMNEIQIMKDMNLKEGNAKIVSLGKLSQLNMVKAAMKCEIAEL